MEKEKSDDSYCTTDDGAEKDRYDEDLPPEPIKEKEGDIVKLKDDNVIKTIKKVGECSYKPIQTDNAIIESSCYYFDIDTKEKKEIPELCNFTEKEEINLSDKNVPKSFFLGVSSMRIGEEAELKIKFKYIFRFLSKNKDLFEEKLKYLYDEEFQKKYDNEKLIVDVKLVHFYEMQNLMDKGEIRKKIIRRSGIKRHIYAKNSDIVTYSLQCIYKNKEIYKRENITSQLDVALEKKELFEIENRVIQNTREDELAVVNVEATYMDYRNKEFLKKYELDNTEPTIFICEVQKVKHYEYVYNVDKDRVTKSQKLFESDIGKDTPDREMLVKMKLQIKVDGQIKYNNFEKENVEDYIQEGKYTSEFKKWREEMNSKYNIESLDDEIDFKKCEEIYNECKFNNILDIDLKTYTMPNYMRKVIIHMKRNDICYIRTSYLDYFIQDNCELADIGQLNDINSPTKVEIYIHLYEFLQTPSFSKKTYEEKLEGLSKYKQIADQCFKTGKIFRAMKVYHNLNYRFDEGDIFGSNKKAAEEGLKEKNKSLYDELCKMRINVHNNYALTKIKLGKILTAYETLLKVINEFDSNHPKTLYLMGKCCIELSKFKDAVNYVRKLNEIQPNDANVKALLEQAEKLNNNDLNKEKKMFQKMLKYSE